MANQLNTADHDSNTSAADQEPNLNETDKNGTEQPRDESGSDDVSSAKGGEEPSRSGPKRVGRKREHQVQSSIVKNPSQGENLGLGVNILKDGKRAASVAETESNTSESDAYDDDVIVETISHQNPSDVTNEAATNGTEIIDHNNTKSDSSGMAAVSSDNDETTASELDAEGNSLTRPRKKLKIEPDSFRVGILKNFTGSEPERKKFQAVKHIRNENNFHTMVPLAVTSPEVSM